MYARTLIRAHTSRAMHGLPGGQLTEIQNARRACHSVRLECSSQQRSAARVADADHGIDGRHHRCRSPHRLARADGDVTSVRLVNAEQHHEVVQAPRATHDDVAIDTDAQFAKAARDVVGPRVEFGVAGLRHAIIDRTALRATLHDLLEGAKVVNGMLPPRARRCC